MPQWVLFFIRQNGDSYQKWEIYSGRNYVMEYVSDILQALIFQVLVLASSMERVFKDFALT